MMPQYNANWLTGYKQKTAGSEWKPTRNDVLETLKHTRATGLGTDGNLEVIDQSYVDAIRAAGLEFHVWTVNDAAPARIFVSRGVNSITTDRPMFIRNAIQLATPEVR
jgi:glycerophosphoryl diester phosphodiesterase